MDLSKKERLILWNQYEILKALYPENKDVYDVEQKIVLSGYKHNYDELISGMFDETPEDVSKFVIDVFSMFRSLIGSYKNLKREEKEEIKNEKILFKGYDGNDELDYYDYSKFFLDDFDKFGEIKAMKDFEYNSHCAMVGRYSEMLRKWKEVRISKYDDLTLEQIKYITEEY
ncbi:YfbU family protein [Clostridium sp. YIM B02506]|uniref:YfbU family protein n=1 Tax=Clostridium sp. YIM B02506 TaxID=2910680 RepID=UPI001EEDCDD3|nr:YfbU family protein [Clostridium sp. YIM B02506]